MDRSSFAKKIREMRESQNLTQAEVSRALGYTTPQFVSNQERGFALPPLKALPILADLYKTNPDELFDEMFDALMDEYQETLKKQWERYAKPKRNKKSRHAQN